MRRPLGKGYVKTVIVGMAYVREAIDLRQVREFAAVRSGDRLAVCSICFRSGRQYAGSQVYIASAQRRLVDVREAEEFGSVVANVGNVHGKVICDGPLDAQGPGTDV